MEPVEISAGTMHRTRSPRRRLAERLGFSYEGTLRRARLRRGELRDVEVHALVVGDHGWPSGT